MNKTQMIDIIADKANLSRAQAKLAMDSTFGCYY